MPSWRRLTAEEATALREELEAVIARYRRHTPEGQERAERVSVITHVLPESDVAVPPTGSPVGAATETS